MLSEKMDLAYLAHMRNLISCVRVNAGLPRLES